MQPNENCPQTIGVSISGGLSSSTLKNDLRESLFRDVDKPKMRSGSEALEYNDFSQEYQDYPVSESGLIKT